MLRTSVIDFEAFGPLLTYKTHEGINLPCYIQQLLSEPYTLQDKPY